MRVQLIGSFMNGAARDALVNQMPASLLLDLLTHPALPYCYGTLPTSAGLATVVLLYLYAPRPATLPPVPTPGRLKPAIAVARQYALQQLDREPRRVARCTGSGPGPGPGTRGARGRHGRRCPGPGRARGHGDRGGRRARG